MILGIEMTRRGATSLLCDVSDAELRLVRRGEVAFGAGSTPAQQWLAMVALVRDECDAVALVPEKLDGLGLAFEGALSSEGRVLSSAETSVWSGYDLGRGLREHLGITEPKVCSRALALGLAEARFGAIQNAEDWLFVALDRKIEGAARLGNREWTPEIGSLLIERDGAMDDFGRRGTLAAYCTPSALQNNAASYGFNPDHVADLWRLASSNFAAQSLVEEFTERLAQGICNLLVALRPPILCIGGEFGRAIWPVLEPNLVFKLREFAPARVLEGLELRGSTLDKDAGAWGALALVLASASASANSQSAALAYSPPAR